LLKGGKGTETDGLSTTNCFKLRTFERKINREKDAKEGRISQQEMSGEKSSRGGHLSGRGDTQSGGWGKVGDAKKNQSAGVEEFPGIGRDGRKRKGLIKKCCLKLWGKKEEEERKLKTTEERIIWWWEKLERGTLQQ